MMTHPMLVIGALSLVVGGVLSLEGRPALERVFRYLPTPFWCYFIPMILTSFGVFPEKSAVYSFLGSYVLGGCLLLLLLSVHLPGIARMGPTALGATAVGSLGIALGAIVSYTLLHPFLPAEMWKGVGALSGSWTGGSANMLAIKEALDTPESVFASLVVVDTLVAYSWMALLVGCSSLQSRWDRWLRADRTLLDDISRRLSADPKAPSLKKAPSWHALWLMPLAIALAFVFFRIGEKLPSSGVINAKGWALILISVFGVALSFTRASYLESKGASRWGYVFLYLLLASMGAQAKLQHLAATPVVLGMAGVWIGIHAAILLAYGIWKRLPLFFLATASQANIGGVASTPIVAAVYEKSLAPAGLLLAISCNLLGTYIGLAIAAICRGIAS